jgi:hypothetical protein
MSRDAKLNIPKHHLLQSWVEYWDLNSKGIESEKDLYFKMESISNTSDSQRGIVKETS